MLLFGCFVIQQMDWLPSFYSLTWCPVLQLFSSMGRLYFDMRWWCQFIILMSSFPHFNYCPFFQIIHSGTVADFSYSFKTVCPPTAIYYLSCLCLLHSCEISLFTGISGFLENIFNSPYAVFVANSQLRVSGVTHSNVWLIHFRKEMLLEKQFVRRFYLLPSLSFHWKHQPHSSSPHIAQLCALSSSFTVDSITPSFHGRRVRAIEETALILPLANSSSRHFSALCPYLLCSG